MLGTNVREIESKEEFNSHVNENETTVICAGRRGPMCVPVYGAMAQMEKEKKFSEIEFRVVDFDTNAAMMIRTHEKCRNFMGLPFTVYYKDGEIVHATSSIQSRKQIEEHLDEYLL